MGANNLEECEGTTNENMWFRDRKGQKVHPNFATNIAMEFITILSAPPISSQKLQLHFVVFSELVSGSAALRSERVSGATRLGATLQQDREPLRGKSAFESVSERISVFRGFQRLSEVFRGPLIDPLRGRFPSQKLSVLLPLIVLPLETPTMRLRGPPIPSSLCP